MLSQKKKNILLTILSIALLIMILIIPGLFAVFTDELVVMGHAQMGVVDIGINEYTLDSEGNTIPNDGVVKEYQPSEFVSSIPKITNYGEKCYIRVKLDITGGNEERKLSETDIEGMDTELWIKKGDYYYYLNEVDKDESINLYNGVNVPTEWTNELVGDECKIQIQVEAIQAIHFSPDFTSENPWGDVEIEECAAVQH